MHFRAETESVKRTFAAAVRESVRPRPFCCTINYGYLLYSGENKMHGFGKFSIFMIFP